jgi:sigma-B regulation protein RsbU (phosphoserine phosphatase)
MTLSRLQRIDRLVKEISYLDDPDRLIRVFGEQSAALFQHDGLVTVSRRGLEAPRYRVTRSWRWREAVNPWVETQRLPILEGGLLARLLYGGAPVLLNDFRLDPDDPAREHLEGVRSLIAAPGYDQGKPVYLVLGLRNEPDGFSEADLEPLLLNANLLGRAAVSMQLAQQLQEAYHRLDYETQQVGRIQRHLLPAQLPTIDGLELAASYRTCERAGGDYYDVLSLPGDRWGLFLADVSGHGTPAAVVMAMLHTLLHAYPGVPLSPAEVLAHLSHHLLAVAPDGMFATAFYGVYHAPLRHLCYAVAGHPPPRLRRAGRPVESLPPVHGLPLGILPSSSWDEADLVLCAGDALLLYTDGVLEGNNRSGALFGYERLDGALTLGPTRAEALVRHIERRYKDFCDGVPDADDRTLLAAVGVP